MKKLSDFTLISDVDGTLINHDGTLPERNILAINRFIQAGGKFGIATGRSRGLMLEAAGSLPINAPCVLYNGGALYDLVNDKMLMELFLPEAAKGYVNEIIREAPDIGALVISDDSYYQIKTEEAFAAFYEIRGEENFHVRAIDDVKMPWYKILFQVPEERFHDFIGMARAKNFDGVRFVGTNYTLVEMLPAQSSKGYALGKLIELGLVAKENLVGIGDFYNDKEMIEMAGIGITLCDAPEDLRALADLVVGDCPGGAVADAIEYLERLCVQ